MKLKNVSARPYGIGGKMVAPLDEIDVDGQDYIDIQFAIENGDFVEVADDAEIIEERKRPGRKPKVDADE